MTIVSTFDAKLLPGKPNAAVTASPRATALIKDVIFADTAVVTPEFKVDLVAFLQLMLMERKFAVRASHPNREINKIRLLAHLWQSPFKIFIGKGAYQ